MNNNTKTKSRKPAKPKVHTQISAEIETIDKGAEAKLSRVQEKDVELSETDNPSRDFEGGIKVKNLKGTLSLADIIKENTRTTKKRIIL
jgi:hypothetical protein